MPDDVSELPPRLHCEGSRLIKPNGNPVTLRGVNLGAIGGDNAADPPQIAALGANCARIGLRWWGLHDPVDIDSRDNDGFAFFKRANFVDWLDKITAASEAGLWVVPFIDSNCGQCGMQDAATMRYCDPYGTWGARGRSFFTDSSMRRLFAQVVWPAAAARLRTVAKIALLELQPEPHPVGMDKEAAAAAVRDFYREVITSVRAVDTDTPFLIGPREGYSIKFCDEAFLDDRTDVVYTGNLLDQWVVDPDKFDSGLATLVDMRDTYNVPVFNQQLGRKSANDPDLSLMRRALARMHEEQVGYTWWQWKQTGTNAGGYGLHYEDGEGGWIEKGDEVAALAEVWAK